MIVTSNNRCERSLLGNFAPWLWIKEPSIAISSGFGLFMAMESHCGSSKSTIIDCIAFAGLRMTAQ